MKIIDIENIEKLINLTTDSWIQNKEFEMRKTNDLKKLNLWIVGLSSGIQLFLFSNLPYSKTDGFTTWLFLVASLSFLYNAAMGLYNHKTVVGINSFEIQQQQRLNGQRILLISALSNRNKLQADLIGDYNSGELALKLIDLNYYIEQNHEVKSIVSTGKKLNQLTEYHTTIILIIQFISVVILLICK